MPTPGPGPDRHNPSDLNDSKGADPRPSAGLPLDELRAFAWAVLREMVANRDVKWDEAGRPVATLRHCGSDSECTWLSYEVDMSAIGMPMDTPLIVQSYAGERFISWSLGVTPLAETPRGRTSTRTASANSSL